jgi:hypothetical protein
MLIPAICSFCARSGTFSVEIKFTHHLKLCAGCSDIKDEAWTFRFCGPECLKEWTQRHLMPDFGFPCQDCLDFETGIPTGWLGGYRANQENVTCPTCKGARKVRECTRTGWKQGGTDR